MNTSFESDESSSAETTQIQKLGTVPSTSSSSSECNSGENLDSPRKSSVPETLKSVECSLSLSKNMGQSDLQATIEKCKQMVLESAECSEERKWLVRRLIELRLRAQELRESSVVLETCVILGHHFSPKKCYISGIGSIYCDHCSGSIWTMLQSWYMCSDCGFCCHMKCLSQICRVCVHVIASEAGGYTYTKDICPERGLSGQSYKCAECSTKITFHSGSNEARLCDYSGLFYCQKCHWNSLAIIPARVVRNWDFEPRRVGRAAFQLLLLLQNKPVLDLESLNPKLFTLMPDLSLIKTLRCELQMMKQYLVICPEAKKQGLPWKCGLRTHMLENHNTYSMSDLVNLYQGILMDHIQNACNKMKSHITELCELCKARGHLCEICGNNEIIYPWDTSATCCHVCNTIYHRLCWTKRKEKCPKCLRIQNRQISIIDTPTPND